VKVNLLLAFFNLIPVPPLDGFKVFFSLAKPGPRTADIRAKIEYIALPLLLIFVLLVWPLVIPIMTHLFALITGMPMSA
jgi:Zn-dependent protease